LGDLWAGTAAVAQVTTADEVCTPSADPCLVQSPIHTGVGAVLDFGDRELRITGSGQIDTDGNGIQIRCGKLTFAKTGTEAALDLSGPGPGGESQAGVAIIEVRRRCSLDPTVFCVRDSTCQARPVPAGICSVGRGDASISGVITGNADEAGFLTLRAASHITVDDPISMDTANPQNDGGSIDLTSEGSITVNAKLTANSGFFGTGGDVCLTAADSVTVTGAIEVVGGDFDGGFVELTANGGDIRVTEDINANSASGEGWGGEISLLATGNIEIVGGASGNRLLLSTDGHLSSELFGGDGGTQYYFADGDITMGPFVRLTSIGAPPDGAGDEISLEAGGDIFLEADIDSRADPAGNFGDGGFVFISANGTVEVTSASKSDLTGPGSGGSFEIDALGAVNFAGIVDARGGANGAAGTADFVSDSGLLTFAGTVTTDGAPSATTQNLLIVRGCHIELTAAARIDNLADNARTQIQGRESIHLATGGRVLADHAQGNEFRYRTGTALPDLDGTVQPAPLLIADANLLDCPVCGNGNLEHTETCDDGNTNPLDGCSAQCQNEGCVAQTPGYPANPLCDDDDGCTTDRCNVDTSQCEHVLDCSDGIDCTQDLCSPSRVCVHQASPALCDDGVSCTTDRCCTGGGGACLGTQGCLNTPVDSACDDGETCTDESCDPLADCVAIPKAGPCDDDVACTAGDQCVEGMCQGTSTCSEQETCNVLTGLCQSVTTTTAPPGSSSTTTTSTTTTTLPTGGFCGDDLVEPPEECDDGSGSWLLGQFCNAGCEMVACGDPDDSGQLSAPDALFILRSAVGLSVCDACICNVDGSTGGLQISATDALRALRRAVGIPVTLSCPSCI
jgi:cysteine-rich repeat protein